MTLHPFVTQRYNVLAKCYRARGWTPPSLPDGMEEASNLVYQMVARLNDREPLTVRMKKPLVVEDGSCNKH